MIEAIFKNRHGESIKFSDDEKGTVEMTGYYPGAMGISGGTVVNNKITDPSSVDPSGGPYISNGQNLDVFFQDGKSRIIHHIQLGEKIVFLYE